jgi:hypothetical protein
MSYNWGMIKFILLAALLFYIAYPDEKKKQREFWVGILKFFNKKGRRVI